MTSTKGAEGHVLLAEWLGCLTKRVLTTLAASIIVISSLPLAAATSRKVQRILLAVVAFNISWQVGKHFFLRQSVADLGSIGGLEISLTNLALAGLYIGWIVRIVTQPRSFTRQQRGRAQVTLPAVLLMLFCAISLLVARDATLSVFGLWSALELFLLYLYIAKNVNSRDDVLFIVRIMLIGLIVQSTLMLAQAGGIVGNFNAYGFKARADFAGDNRISGTFGSPNPAAAYLAMVMVAALGVIFADVARADKYLAGIGVAMAAVPLVFTLSRGGWLSFALGVATMFLVSRRRLPRKTMAMVVVVIVLLIIPFTGSIMGRLSGDDNGSAAARMPLNKLAATMISDHPILGVGVNNFAIAMGPYLRNGFSGEFLYTVHNTCLLIWAETGIGGLVAFVWLLIAIVRQGSKCWQLRHPLFAPLGLSCTAAVVACIVQMSFEPFRTEAAYHMLWLFGGLLTAMHRLSASSPCVPQA